MAKNQDSRFLQLQSPGPLNLVGFRGHEEISRLFRFDLDLISDEKSIDAKSIVGMDVSFSVADKDDQRRPFHGYVSRFIAGDEDDKGQRNYRAEVVPWLWFLTRKSDCRIFTDKTIPQIIEEVLSDYKDLAQFEINAGGHYQKREYCVQYRETDFNFISRLMEDEGLFYFFRHAKGSHKLIIADSTSIYEPCISSPVHYQSTLGKHLHVDHLTSWEHQYSFRSGKWSQQDYNFETPGTNLLTNSNSLVSLNKNAELEFYDYPGEYTQKSDGSYLTKVRMQEEEVDYEIVSGSGTCRYFTSGQTFQLGEHHASAEKKGHKSYLITGLHHSAVETQSYSSGATSQASEYTNTFTCVPDTATFRAARLTAKPSVQGVQTAVVVGPKGEEIYCDKYGRVKVQFHWDREGKKDQNSSCWIRCSHNIAGKQWGFQAIPRIGQEVVIDFLEGDPDRPLIVGSVYNAEQMPHYPLPEANSRTYIKTNSTKGGDGYNELMFEDKKDDERVYLHAQNNMDVRVRANSSERIYGHRHQIIGWEKDGKKGGDQREKIYEDKHLNVKRNSFEHVEGNVQLQVGNGEADSGGDLHIVLEKNRHEQIGGDTHLIVDGGRMEKVDGNSSHTIGGDLMQKVGGNIAAEAGAMGEIHLKAGMNIVIEAGMQLTLKGPGGFISIGPDGVTVQGILVKINSGGSAGSGKGCKPEEPEPPEAAAPTEPSMAWNSKTGLKSAP